METDNLEDLSGENKLLPNSIKYENEYEEDYEVEEVVVETDSDVKIKDEIIEIEDHQIESDSASESEICNGDNIDSYELFIDTEEQEELPKGKPRTSGLSQTGFIAEQNPARHLTALVSEKQYECKYCSRRFAGKEHFLKHALLHRLSTEELDLTREQRITWLLEQAEVKGNKERNLQTISKSEFCIDNAAYSNRLLVDPLGQAEPPKQEQYTCRTCGKTFVVKHNLIRHMTVHASDKQYQCRYCVRRFFGEANFLKHALQHEVPEDEKLLPRDERIRRLLEDCEVGGKNKTDQWHTCTVCQKQFTTDLDLKCHERSHSKKTYHTCRFCPKSFEFKSLLATHERTHTKESPFACEVCGRRFRQKASVTTHMYIHTSKNPWACIFCDRQFKRRSQAYRHALIFHGEIGVQLVE